MIDADVRSVLRSLDYKVILWDIDTRDWAHTPPCDIAANIVDNISSGDIILMHDYIAHNSPTPEALRLFIPELIQKGYKFVVISELIGLE
jgi:peptidoglycan/xylan/chitin deacetylase (PgdA/CDA1 family)